MAKSPTSRTLEYCKKHDILCGVVERRVGPPGARGVTKDLYGFIDLIAVERFEVGALAIQACARCDVQKRYKKSTTGERGAALRRWLDNMNEYEIWGWGKMANGRWQLRRIRVTYNGQDFEQEDL